MTISLHPELQRRAKIALILGFALGLTVFFLLGGQRWLSLEFIKANRDGLLGFTQAHYGLTLFLAGLIYVLATAFSIPGGAVLSLAIGALFGRWVGTVVTVIGATIGATALFLAARFVFGEAVNRKLAQHPAGSKLLEGFSGNAFNYLLFLRLVPLFPFWLVNLVPAVTDIDIKTYVKATFLGIIPGSFIYVNLGHSLAEINSLKDLLSFEVLLALTLLGLFSLLPVFVNTSPQENSD